MRARSLRLGLLYLAALTTACSSSPSHPPSPLPSDAGGDGSGSDASARPDGSFGDAESLDSSASGEGGSAHDAASDAAIGDGAGYARPVFPATFALVSPFDLIPGTAKQARGALPQVAPPREPDLTDAAPSPPPPDGGNPPPPSACPSPPPPDSSPSGVDPLPITWHPGRTNDAPPPAVTTQLAKVIGATSASACAVQLYNEIAGDPPCYGQQVGFQNDPDGVCTPYPTSPGGSTMQCAFGGGDLGIQTPTDDAGGACAAAKLNSDIAFIGARVNSALLVGASMACLASTSGGGAPLAGQLLDMTSALAASLATLNPCVSVVSGSFAANALVVDAGTSSEDAAVPSDASPDASVDAASGADASADGASGIDGSSDAGAAVDGAGGAVPLVYTYSFELTTDVSSLTATLTFVPTSPDESTYYGVLRGRIDEVPPDGGTPSHSSVGFSVDYAVPVATALRYQMFSANFPPGASSMFDPTGHLDQHGPWKSSMTETSIDMDPTTGFGKGAYLWQAGVGDPNTRVFNVFTEAGDAGAARGCGFFGFGAPFADAAVPPSNVEQFICNWHGPNPNHDSHPNLSQKQCMTAAVSDAGVLWVPTESNISYAPVMACESSDASFIGGPFGTDPSTWTPFPTTYDLVDLRTDPDYATYGIGPVPPPLAH